jgi:beta-glucanase (GH16 family)
MFDRLHRHGRLIGIGLAAALLNACGGGGASSPETEPFYIEEQEEWSLVWADEFNGSSVDSSNWAFQTGDGSDNGLPGWGNYELQYYQADNASIQEVDGESSLVIEARQESVGSSAYTSSRMRSINKFDFQYGRVEIKAKAAPGDGMWSAIWMLPTSSPYGVWAASGEVDIMEVVNAGTENQGVFLAAHYGFEWPLNQITTAGADVDDASDWHTYALEWSGDYLRWFVDGDHLRTVSKDVYYSYYFKDSTDGYQLATDPAAPFDRDFHLLVNLAVGGVGPGVDLDPAAVPGEMVVDYIRVYECNYATGDGTGCNTYADRSLESPDAQSPEVVTTDIYTDSVGPLTWEFLTGDVTRDLQAMVGYDNDGAIGITVSEVAVEGRGNVLDVMSDGGGNVVINAVDGKIIDVYGHRGGGELKFDMYIDSSMTAPGSSIAVKMDSGFPALGFVSLNVADMPTNEWFSYSVSINQLLANRGDRTLALGAVQNLVVIEPSAAAHVQLDNIRLVCGTPGGDCGVSAPARATDDLVITVIDENGQAGSAWSPGICAVSAENAFADDYCDGNTSNQVTWSVVPTGDDSVGVNAVQIDFGAGVGGAWFVKDDQGLDLSDSNGGTLKFDINLTAATAADGVIYKVENEYPQGTGPIELDLAGYVAGTWKSFEIPIADLLLSTNAELNNPPGGRLNLAAVKAFLVLSPNGEQGGKSVKVANVRLERLAGEEVEDTGILGTWMLAPEAGSLGVGPAEFDVTWWNGDDGVIALRACYYDDEYVFGRDGSFRNVLGEETWLEAWQGVEADTCGAPIAPHDGSIDATFEYDEAAQTLTINGQGSYMGLAKAVNGAELASIGDTPGSIVYNAYEEDDGSLLVTVEAGVGVWWNYKFIKTAEPPEPSAFEGTWMMAPEPGSLGVGPAEFDVTWWMADEGVLAARACYFDDEYIFNPDGSFRVEYQDETWLEPWQSGGAEECGAPVAPHDGSIPGTWSHDQEAGTLTIGGQGSYVGIPKAINGAEISSAADVPGSITYNVYEQEDGSYAVTVEAGDGVWWNYKIVKTAGPAEPSPIAGTWYMAQSDGSLGVGPAEFDVTWWSNDAGVTALRACYFDDAYVFGADGSFSNLQDGDTWLEPWQSGGAEECGAPVAPHDGSTPASFVFDAEMNTLSLSGVGAYIGIPKAINGAEIDSAAAVPAGIDYNAYLNEDGTMSVTVEAGDGVWWNYLLTR